ncbi:MAG TPA: hypothetical protein VJ743_03925 [Albitalea sp.]|nr:hypothetical protein [Albitalea sp.]
MSRFDPLPPFPVLLDEPADTWAWPALPFDWRHVPAPGVDVAQPCVIETSSGTEVEGFMHGMDAAAATIGFRSASQGATLSLPFARFRRLTLSTPLRAIDPPPGRPVEQVPRAAQEREYRLLAADGSLLASGRSVGVVQPDEGLFLFIAAERDKALQRVFVPRWAYGRCELGPTAQDVAAERWVASPAALLAAIDRQRRTPVLPIGQSLIELGLLTAQQLEQALAQPAGDAPLGERLVEDGVISRADLQTAIAHKMGYPVVDLTRFPVDPAAARKLPLRMAVRHRALPIMLDGQRLIVAMDRPSRALELERLCAVAPLSIVAVLASKGQILLALSGMSERDVWTEQVAIRPQFFATTN